MGSYVPTTAAEREQMLAQVGVKSLNDLYAAVPQEMFLHNGLNLPEGLSELEVREKVTDLAEKNLRFSEKLTHMGQRTTRAKLMSYFSAEAQRLGTYEFDIPFSRQQLADYLAVERSGLSLELGKMRDEGLLDFHKSHFVLKV